MHRRKLYMLTLLVFGIVIILTKVNIVKSTVLHKNQLEIEGVLSEESDSMISNECTIKEMSKNDSEEINEKESKSVRAADLGIIAGKNCATQLTHAVEQCYKNGIDTIYFDEGDYYLESKVLLYPVNLIGKGFKESSNDINVRNINKNVSELTLAEEMACIKKKENQTRFVFDRFTSNANNNGWGYGFVIAKEGEDGFYHGKIKNIDWYLNTEAAPFIEKDVIFVMFQINECKNVVIEDCNFIVEGQTETSRVSELWFRDKNKENVVINNCGFINDNAEYQEYGIAGGKGGCLWVWGGLKENNKGISTTRDFLINDCNFLTTCGDEAIAIWETYIDDVEIINCEISNRIGNSGNLLAIYDVYSNQKTNGKISVVDLRMEINTACIYPFKLFGIHDGVSTYVNNFEIDVNINEKPKNGKNYAIRAAILAFSADENIISNVVIDGLNVRAAEDRVVEKDYKVIYSLVKVSNIANCQISKADVSGDIGILFENEMNSKSKYNIMESKFKSTREYTTIAVPYGDVSLDIFNSKLIDCSTIFIPKKESIINIKLNGCTWITDYWLKGINYGAEEVPADKSQMCLNNSIIKSSTDKEFFFCNYSIEQNDVMDISVEN